MYNAANWGLSVINDATSVHINGTVTGTRLNVFLCPSCPAPGWNLLDTLVGGRAPGNNYFASVGSGMEYSGQQTANPPNGIFQHIETTGRVVGVRDITDGTTNTIAFGEWKTGTGLATYGHARPGHRLPRVVSRGSLADQRGYGASRQPDPHRRAAGVAEPVCRRIDEPPAGGQDAIARPELGLRPLRLEHGQPPGAAQREVSELHPNGADYRGPRPVRAAELPLRRNERPDLRRLGEVPQGQYQPDVLWALGSARPGRDRLSRLLLNGQARRSKIVSIAWSGSRFRHCALIFSPSQDFLPSVRGRGKVRRHAGWPREVGPRFRVASRSPALCPSHRRVRSERSRKYFGSAETARGACAGGCTGRGWPPSRFARTNALFPSILRCTMNVMSEVTRLLDAIEQGDPTATESLLPLVYDELRRLAARRLVREKPGQTLDGTALVHEAYLAGGGRTRPPLGFARPFLRRGGRGHAADPDHRARTRGVRSGAERSGGSTSMRSPWQPRSPRTSCWRLMTH